MKLGRMRRVEWWLVAVAFALGGCKADIKPAVNGGASSPWPSKEGRTVSANLTGYNHTDKTIGAFYVNGIWGGNVTPGSGGGSFVCCAELPAPWRAGTAVKVSWEDHEGKTHEKTVAVPQYDDATLSRLSVHFLRSGEVKVFANRLSLWHPDYPLKGEEAQLRHGEPTVRPTQQ